MNAMLDPPAPEPYSSTLGLRLHGEPVLVLGGGRAVALEPRAAALLALAAFEPGLTRLRAATLLWPDSNDPRRNLRQQLLRFRRQFERELLIGRDTIALAPGVLLEAGDQPLLGGLDFAEIEDFAVWLTQRRHEAHGARVQAVRARLAAAEAAGDYDMALLEAEHLLAIDWRDEAHHRERMRLHYLAGNLGAGLAAYDTLRRMLAEEYGTRPSAATLQLAEALGRAERAAVSLPLPTARLPVTLKRPPRMAGRASDLAAVQRAVAEGRVVWLEGEAGLGKSRLVSELLGTWHTGAVLAGAGRPGDAGAPYVTLARWLGPWLHADLGALGGRARRALRHLGGEAQKGREHNPLRPGEMAQAVADLLALQRTSLVVLDDVHFADEATLELVAGLATQADRKQRWLFAARPAEVTDAGRALREALIELQRLEVVELAPLDEADLAELVDALGVEGLDGSALAEPLRRHTGGNPLFVLETLKQGLHDGSLARGELPRPGNVATMIELRLGRLSEDAITLARVAAIAGVDFSIELAESAIGVRAVQLAGSWQELQDAHVLRDENFAHDLVSEAVLRGVPQPVARRMHAQCAQWLHEHGGEPARVAQHWWQGGESTNAGRAFVEAARQANRMVRYRDEADLYTLASRAFDAAGRADDAFDARCRRLIALRHIGDIESTLRENEALIASAHRDAQRVQAQVTLAGTLGEWGEFARCVEVAREIMPLARSADAPNALADACGFLSVGLCQLGRPDEALATVQAVLIEVRDRIDSAEMAALLNNLANAQGCVGRLNDALASFEQARKLLQASGQQADLQMMLGNLANTLRRSGRVAQALSTMRESQKLLEDDSGDSYRSHFNRLLLARSEHEVGHFGAALENLETALRYFQAEGPPAHAQYTRLTLASLWLRLGQPARSMALLADEQVDLPPWMSAERLQLQQDLALALQQPRSSEALMRIDELAQLDIGLCVAIRAPRLRHLDAAQRFEVSRALSLQLAAAGSEEEGVKATVDLHWCSAALAIGRLETALTCATRLVRRLDDGISPEQTYTPEAWWVAHQAYTAAGRTEAAARALHRGVEWILQEALPHVPAPFVDSFLHRNPVNRALLAAASM